MDIFALPESTMEKVNDLLTRQCSSPEELMSVLWQTEAIFNKQNVLTVLAYLLNYDLLIELVLSGLHTTLPFEKWLIDRFPANQPEYLTSIFPKLISRISDFLNSPEFSQKDGAMDQLQEYHELQEATTSVFQLLSQLNFESLRPSKHGKSSVKNFRRDRKNSVSIEDPTTEMLARFSLAVPTTIEERDDAIAVTIGRMKQALKFYLTTLGQSESQIKIMALFLSKQEPSTSRALEDQGIADDPDIKSFDLADRLQRFGEWKIFVSTRAARNLRDARRKAPVLFDIIVKKMRELSQGYFTDDNQKRLNGPEVDIPVFEAKMSRDTRLVYQIHCEYNYNTKVDEQVIRVFGVYTHAKLGKRLWDSIGRQLGQKGSEYRRRCLYREAKNTGYGDSVFIPAKFSLSPQDAAPAAPSTLKLPAEDLEKVHDILVLEKYMDMSEGLLQSILEDLEVSFPFQLSSQERKIVEYKGSSYILGRSGTGKTTCMLYKIIWKELLHHMHSDTIAKPRQLFVTKSKNLVTKVREEFDKLSVSFQFSHPVAQHPHLDKRLGAPASRKSKLPLKFSELEEDHFPLFITYDELLRLIEEDHGISFEKHWGADDRPLLTFSKFLKYYWPRLAHRVGRRLDPNIVFNEIIGCYDKASSSEQSLSSEHYFLDRESYQGLSTRTNPTFAGLRDELYSLYESYRKCKREFGDHDSAERTHTLLKKLYGNNLKGKRIDQLYVDEAQDNLLIDALVLRSFCHNANGLFWAGDTAQTILAGSSFRFEDLKSFLYRIEQKRLDTITPSQKYFSTFGSAPAMFQLTTNYRSHIGITNCAHAVIELISTFWPEAIDALAPEQGVVNGAKPVFLVEWGNAHILSKSSTGVTMELGPNQCVLVRDEEARNALRSELNNATIVKTIYDSKGLEFDDVVLLNFFKDSLCDVSQWRLVLNNLKESPYVNQQCHAPAFNPLHHAGLCIELKFLYVALTRARKTLWIADQSEKGEPMKEYWLSRNEIIVLTSNSGLEQLVTSSSLEDWAARAEDFFQRGDYATAMQCFERAGLHQKASEAHALHLREIAQEIPTNFKSQRRQAYIRAAEAFLNCASQLTRDSEILFLTKAGQCLALAGEYMKAADIFRKVHDFDSAATCYMQLDAFGILLEFFPRNRKKLSGTTITKVRINACPHYYRQGDFDNASRFFSSPTEEIAFLRDRGWTSFLAPVYIKAEQWENAARIYLAEKQVMRAIPLFLRSQPTCTREASRYILNELWKFLSFSRKPIQNSTVDSLFKMWEDVKEEHSGSDLRDEYGLLRAVFTFERPKLAAEGKTYVSKKNVPAALLCFSLYFMDFPTKANHAEDAAMFFECFYLFIAALGDFTFPGSDTVDVDAYPLFFYLFGIRSASSSAFLCLPNTFLYSDLAHGLGEAVLVGRQTKEGLEIPRSALKARFRQNLDIYLNDKFEKEGKLFEAYLSLHTPCILINALGSCHRHRSGEANQCHRLSTDYWRNRISIILAHSVVTDRLSKRLELGIPAKQKIAYMNELYKSLVLLSARLENCPLLDQIPAIEDGRHVVRYWSGHPGFSLDYDNADIILLWFLRGSKTNVLRADQRPVACHLQWARLSLGSNRPQIYFPPRHGFSLGSLIPDLEILHPEHQLNRIEMALKVFSMVLKIGWRIELDVLCTWIEYLTGLILVKLLWSEGSPKQVTLPLATAIQCINWSPDPIDTDLAEQHSTLFNLVGEVVQIIFSPSVKGRFGFPYDFSAFPATDMNVARICRSWCILGYNYQDFTPQLLAAFKRLRISARRSPSLSGMYLFASTGQDLLSAVLRTTFSPDQRLVRLREQELGVEDKAQRKEIKTLEYDQNQPDQLFDQLVSLACPRLASQAAQTAAKAPKGEVSPKAPGAETGPASHPVSQPVPGTVEIPKDIGPEGSSAHSVSQPTQATL